MFNSRKAFLMICLLLTLPLSGCTSSTPSQSQTLEGETLVEIQNPCTNPSEAISQSLISIMVNGDERVFRLTAPDSEAGTRLPVVLAFHGGGDAEDDFPQQTQFDQLAESEDFIMAYVVAESDRTRLKGTGSSTQLPRPKMTMSFQKPSLMNYRKPTALIKTDSMRLGTP